MNTSSPLWLMSAGAWVVVEICLFARDRRRGRGSTKDDQGTRRLIVISTAITFLLGSNLAGKLRSEGIFALSREGMSVVLVAGLGIFWAGLLLRVLAIATLGSAFRTTVEVEVDQAVVQRGPYRVMRHPSYTGVIVMTTGFGVLTGTWPTFSIAVICPTAVILRRIRVEERVLFNRLGEPYHAYAERTRWRLLPGVW